MSHQVADSSRAARHTQLRRRIRHHYFRLMPDKARHRAALWTVFWLIAGVLVVQLIYPLDRSRPLTLWQGQARGGVDELSLAVEINQAFVATTIKLTANGISTEVPLSSFGAEPATATTVNQLVDYPFWQRYIPLSLFWPHRVDEAAVIYTNLIAQSTCQESAAELSRPATDATLRLEDGQLVATDDVAGWQIDAVKLCRQITQQQLRLGGIIEVTPSVEPIRAEKTADDFRDVRAQADQALAKNLVFVHQDRQFSAEASQRASWLKLNDAAGQTRLGVDRAKLGDYLEELNDEIGRPAGQTNVRVVNGVEVERVVGRTGQAIDYQAVIAQVEQQLLGAAPAAVITLTLEDVAPSIIYNNRYTASQAGLQAYVRDAAEQYNAHIAVQQLDGNLWRAAARETESLPSASTYKLYVAARVFADMEAGHLTWGDRLLDTSVSVCFDRMMIASTNPCAEEWIRQFGREALNRYLYEQGLSRGTTFTSPIAVHTTAADLTRFMVRLDRGELFGDIYKQRLLAAIGNHPYPFGIPAGSVGRVYDKVGFLWDYVHDAAIVEHPHGRYAMTIMTKGQSYARIASITREVERIMYP